MTILLVDDNIVNRRLTSLMLENEGFHVELAVDGKEAIRKAREGSFNIIFMDYQMPGMDGAAATRAIRKFNGEIPIIALTIRESEDIRQKCQKAGMNDFLTKPVRPEALADLVRKWCRERELA